MSKLFGSLRGKHPVQDLLNEQVSHTVRAAAALADMVRADSAERAAINKRLHAVENEADSAAHNVLREVGTNFILPFDRGDLIQLTNDIDNCVDMIDEAGNNLVLYKVTQIPEKVYEMSDIISQCAERAVTATGKLQKIEPSIRNEWLEINNLENRADSLYQDLLAALFASDVSAKQLFISKIVLDSFEAAVDSFESLASTIELLTLKES